MKLSIIIPFYRGEQYLDDCLTGIREGGFDDVEVVVCDDDPMDPRGVAFSRNRGLERAHGDYILFLDSDDYFLPGDIARAMEEALKNPDCVTVLSLCGTFYCRDAVIEKRVPKPFFEMQIPTLQRAVGLIIPSKLIINKRFPERFRYHSELPFVTELSRCVRFVPANGVQYFKRIHNDPVNFPSLSQEESPVRIASFCGSFTEAVGVLRDGITKKTADTENQKELAGTENTKGPGVKETLKALVECAGRFFEAVLTGDTAPSGLGVSPKLTDIDMPAVKKALETVDISVLSDKKDAGKRKILSALAAGDRAKAQKVAKRILFKKKKKGLFGSKNQWRLAFYRKVAMRMKVKKDLVFFESFNGDQYGDSPRYIYEYYIGNNPANRKFVWSLVHGRDSREETTAGKRPLKRSLVHGRDSREETTAGAGKKNRPAVPGKCRFVKPGSMRYMLALARAGILVSNMRQPSWYIKRKGQFFFETWHGTPLKKLVFDMDEVYTASPGYKKIFYDQSRKWDYLLSGNPYSSEVFEHAFMLPKEKIVELGYPRNDRLKAGGEEDEKRALKEKLGLPADKKIILYAPTWRDNKFRGSGDYEMPLPFKKGFSESAKDCFFLLRMHYFVSGTDDTREAFGESAVDVSSYNDINDLYLVSDMLVTDYSSVFFDYALLGRPIVFYAYDEEEYKGELRGLYFDMESYCPGPVVRTQEELADVLKKDEEYFKPYLERFYSVGEFFAGPGDARASERTVKFIEEKYTALQMMTVK